VADAAHQTHHANQHVPLLLFVRPVSTHSINSTKKKKWFRMCERVVRVVEMAGHFHSLLHHHQSTKQVCFGNQRMLAELLLHLMTECYAWQHC
jgi:hypothetical protein